MATLARPGYADLKAQFLKDREEALRLSVEAPIPSTTHTLWAQHAYECLCQVQRIEAAEFFSRPYCAPTRWTLETALASWSWRDVARFLTLLPGSESLVNECVAAIGWSRSESIQAPMHRALVSKVQAFVALTEGVTR